MWFITSVFLVCVCACVCVSALCKVSSWEARIYETLQSHSNGFITYLTYMVDVCVRARVRACMHACVCSLMHARVSTCVSATAATLCLRLLPRSALPLSTVWGDNRKKKPLVEKVKSLNFFMSTWVDYFNYWCHSSSGITYTPMKASFSGGGGQNDDRSLPNWQPADIAITTSHPQS